MEGVINSDKTVIVMTIAIAVMTVPTTVTKPTATITATS